MLSTNIKRGKEEGGKEKRKEVKKEGKVLPLSKKQNYK